MLTRYFNPFSCPNFFPFLTKSVYKLRLNQWENLSPPFTTRRRTLSISLSNYLSHYFLGFIKFTRLGNTSRFSLVSVMVTRYCLLNSLNYP